MSNWDRFWEARLRDSCDGTSWRYILVRYLDKLSPHEIELFNHVNRRWRGLFGARFYILLLRLEEHLFRIGAAGQ